MNQLIFILFQKLVNSQQPSTSQSIRNPYCLKSLHQQVYSLKERIFYYIFGCV